MFVVIKSKSPESAILADCISIEMKPSSDTDDIMFLTTYRSDGTYNLYEIDKNKNSIYVMNDSGRTIDSYTCN